MQKTIQNLRSWTLIYSTGFIAIYHKSDALWNLKHENRCIVGYILSFLQSHNASNLWYFAMRNKPYAIIDSEKSLPHSLIVYGPTHQKLPCHKSPQNPAHKINQKKNLPSNPISAPIIQRPQNIAYDLCHNFQSPPSSTRPPPHHNGTEYNQLDQDFNTEAPLHSQQIVPRLWKQSTHASIKFCLPNQTLFCMGTKRNTNSSIQTVKSGHKVTAAFSFTLFLSQLLFFLLYFRT